MAPPFFSDDEEPKPASPPKLEPKPAKAPPTGLSKKRVVSPKQLELPLAPSGFRYLGDFVVVGWSTFNSSALVKLKIGDVVTFARPQVAPADKGSSIEALKRKAPARKGENILVRFRNAKLSDVGRLDAKDAAEVSKLMDQNICNIVGRVIDCPKNVRVGNDITLSVRVDISPAAFQSIEPKLSPTEERPSKRARSRSPDEERQKNKQKAGFYTDMQETEQEKQLRHRKSSLVWLFKSINMRPVQAASMHVLADLDAALQKPSAKAKGRAVDTDSKVKPVTKEEDEEEDVEGQVDKQLTSNVYARAVMNDARLPEAEPAAGFKLALRGYQKQALHWMTKMEAGQDDAREGLSLHPLWEEYKFPYDDDAIIDLDEDNRQSFYYNSYSGELSLEFPQASKRCQGGILADEMGLGKTIISAAVIHSNRPSPDGSGDITDADNGISSADDDEAESGDEDAYVPLPLQQKAEALKSDGSRKRQARLDVAGALQKRGQGGGRTNATLVVAPMSLVHQWATELGRCSGDHLEITEYYGANRGEVLDLLETGSDVIVTSYGTMTSDYAKWDKDGKQNPRNLFAVEWFRIILDEAHNIRNRQTQMAKAAYLLKGRRRWALTGTPIVNRLEDLQSLLHYIRLEPWGAFSFYRSIVARPWEKGDTKALKVVQVILESCLLRREKSMKDADGQPIVPLPKKTVNCEYLEFSSTEREIYEKVYKNARTQVLGYAKDGNVLRNLTAIFAILMRLRQAVLHPLLVLPAFKEAEKAATLSSMRQDILEIQQLITSYSAGQSSFKDEQLMELDKVIAEPTDPQLSQECPICLDVIEDTTYLPCLHFGCRACILDCLDSPSSDEKPTCPVCEASIDPGLFGQDTKRGKTPATAKSLKAAAPSMQRGSSSEAALEISDSDEETTKTAFEGHQRANGRSQPLFRDETPLADAQQAVNATPRHRSSSPSKVKRLQEVFLQRNDFRSSTKLDALIKHLNRVREEEENFHVVVFSQFTSFLDLCERLLEREYFRFVRLDGTLSQQKRVQVLNSFNEKKSCVLLLSLKTGGVGLNLVVANRAYMMDCYWNAAVELQAFDRIHRFGQQREVVITRFLIKNSIDEQMLAIQARKTAVVEAGLAGAANDEKKKATMEALESVFDL